MLRKYSIFFCQYMTFFFPPMIFIVDLIEDRGSLETRMLRSMALSMYEATIGTPGHLQRTYVYGTRIRPRVLRCYRCIS